MKFVDGASVDSYVYDSLARIRPGLVARTRILRRSSPHPITPVVVRAGLPPDLKERLRKTFLEMDADPRGGALLASLGFRRFVLIADRSYDGIREMRRVVSERYAAPGSATRKVLP